MPYRVLQQGVHRETQPFPVCVHDDRIEPPELPAPLGGRHPLAEHLHRKVIKADRLGTQEIGVLRGGDHQQPLAQPPEPDKLADDHLDVALLMAAAVGQLAGQQFGVAERDGDRGAQLVGGILQEPALGGEQPCVLRADRGTFLVGGEPAL